MTNGSSSHDSDIPLSFPSHLFLCHSNRFSSQIGLCLYSGKVFRLGSEDSPTVSPAGLLLVLTQCLACAAHDYGSCWQLGGPWDHGAESRKGILNYRGEMVLLKKATFHWCLFFPPCCKIFSNGLLFISNVFGLHLLRKFIQLCNVLWWDNPRNTKILWKKTVCSLTVYVKDWIFKTFKNMGEA